MEPRIVREATLRAVGERWSALEKRMKEEGKKVEEVMIMGDLNLKASKRTRR